jgi:hypothetical protein
MRLLYLGDKGAVLRGLAGDDPVHQLVITQGIDRYSNFSHLNIKHKT